MRRNGNGWRRKLNRTTYRSVSEEQNISELTCRAIPLPYGQELLRGGAVERKLLSDKQNDWGYGHLLYNLTKNEARERVGVHLKRWRQLETIWRRLSDIGKQHHRLKMEQMMSWLILGKGTYSTVSNRGRSTAVRMVRAKSIQVIRFI